MSNNFPSIDQVIAGISIQAHQSVTTAAQQAQESVAAAAQEADKTVKITSIIAQECISSSSSALSSSFETPSATPLIIPTASPPIQVQENSGLSRTQLQSVTSAKPTPREEQDRKNRNLAIMILTGFVMAIAGLIILLVNQSLKTSDQNLLITGWVLIGVPFLMGISAALIGRMF